MAAAGSPPSSLRTRPKKPSAGAPPSTPSHGNRIVGRIAYLPNVASKDGGSKSRREQDAVNQRRRADGSTAPACACRSIAIVSVPPQPGPRVMLTAQSASPSLHSRHRRHRTQLQAASRLRQKQVLQRTCRLWRLSRPHRRGWWKEADARRKPRPAQQDKRQTVSGSHTAWCASKSKGASGQLPQNGEAARQLQRARCEAGVGIGQRAPAVVGRAGERTCTTTVLPASSSRLTCVDYQATDLLSCTNTSLWFYTTPAK